MMKNMALFFQKRSIDESFQQQVLRDRSIPNKYALPHKCNVYTDNITKTIYSKKSSRRSLKQK